jgi:signal peptidase
VGRRKARSGPRTLGFWLTTLLNTGAVLGGVCLLAAALGLALGVTPIAFSSDSMAPAISAGDLALARRVSASDLGEGDIVSVTDRRGTRVTHRVVEVQPYGSHIRLTLKADGNGAPDVETYDVTEARRVFATVPLLGHVLAPARGVIALGLGGVFVGCLAVVLFVPRRRRPGTRRATG